METIFFWFGVFSGSFGVRSIVPCKCSGKYIDIYCILKITFYSKLTWSKHINDLKPKVKKSLNLLKMISGFDWGLDKKSLLRIYDALCRSKLDCGCQIYSSVSKRKLNALNVDQSMGLRICSWAFWTSPVESLYVDTHQLPLYLWREELSLRYLMRIKLILIIHPIRLFASWMLLNSDLDPLHIFRSDLINL